MNQSDTITALNADPMDPDKVHIFIDGRHALTVSLDVAASERLVVGQACPADRLARLHTAQEAQRVYEAALNFFSYRPRSAREVEMRLRKKGHSPEQIEGALQRLRRQGYLDDREFSRFWIGNRQTFSPRGPRLLKSELRQKGVPADIVDEMLSEYKDEQAERVEQAAEIAAERNLPEDDAPLAGTDEAAALALGTKRMRLLSSLDEQTARRRLYAFLSRRGYGYDVIGAVMRRLFEAEDDGVGDEE